MGKLTEEARKNLIKSGKDVFFAYQAISMFQKHHAGIDSLQTQITDTALQLDLRDSSELPFQLGNGVTLTAKITRESENKFTVEFGEESQEDLAVKNLADFDSADFKKMLQGKTWTFTQDVDQQWKGSTQVKGQEDQVYQLGGPDKIDLYSLHIANLKKYLDHLQYEPKWYHFFSTSKHNDPAVVSMTTGSGKSFTLALQALVSGLAGVKNVTTVSDDKLLTQLHNDFVKLLPDQFISDHLGDIKEAIREIEINPNLSEDQKVSKVKEAIDGKSVIIGTTTDLIANKVGFTALQQSLTEKKGEVVLAHDEAHLLGKNELIMRGAQKLAKEHKNIYSTATPTRTLMKLAKESGRPVDTIASMTKKEKIEQGYAVPAEEKQFTTKSRREMDKESGKESSWKDIIFRKIASYIDIKHPENIKASYADSLYNITSKDNYTVDHHHFDEGNLPDEEKLLKIARWNIQQPSLSKSLVYVEDFEDIVNLADVTDNMSHTAEGIAQTLIFTGSNGDLGSSANFSHEKTKTIESANSDSRFSLYYNKNDFDTDIVNSAVTLSRGRDMDQLTYQRYQDHKNDQYLARIKTSLKEEAAKHSLNVSEEKITEMAEKMSQGLQVAPVVTSMHGTLDLALSVIAGFTKINNPNNKLAAIIDQFGPHSYLNPRRFGDLPSLTDTLSESATELLARESSREELINLLTYSENNNMGIDLNRATELADIIIGVAQSLKHSEHDIEQTAKNKARIVNNWQADQGVFSSIYNNIYLHQYEEVDFLQKFSSFTAANFKQMWFDTKDLQNNEGIESQRVFSDFRREEHHPKLEKDYKGKVRELRPIEALNPFSSEVVLKPNYQENTNPEIARNMLKLGIASTNITNTIVEGFNDPNLHNVKYIVSDQHSRIADPNTRKQFEGRLRGKDSFVTPVANRIVKAGVKLYENDDLYKKTAIAKAGKDLANQIMDYIKSQKNLANPIDDQDLAAKVTDFLLDSLESNGHKNAFNFAMTEKDFIKVINIAMSHMNERQRELKRGTELNLFIRITASLMYCVLSIFRYFEVRTIRKTMSAKVDQIEEILRQNPENAETVAKAKLYRKSIQKADLMKVLVESQTNSSYSGTIVSTLAEGFQAGLFDSMRVVERYPIELLFKTDANWSHHPKYRAIIEGAFAINGLNQNQANASEVEKIAPTQLFNRLCGQNSNFKGKVNLTEVEQNHYLAKIQNMMFLTGIGPADFREKDDDGNFTQNLTMAKLSDLMSERNFGQQIANQGMIQALPARRWPPVTSPSPDSSGILTRLINNQEARNYFQNKFNSFIKNQCDQFIDNEKYLRSLQYLTKVFDKNDFALILKEGKPNQFEERAEEAVEFISDLKKIQEGSMNKDLFYQKYCTIDFDAMENDPNQVNIRITSIIKNIDEIYQVIERANRKIYGIPNFTDGSQQLVFGENDTTLQEFDLFSGDCIVDPNQERAWSIITNLRQMQNMLPVLNDLNYRKSSEEMKKTEEVSEKMLKNIAKLRLARDSEDILLQESKKFVDAFSQEKAKGSHLNYDQLQSYKNGSRADQIREEMKESRVDSHRGARGSRG